MMIFVVPQGLSCRFSALLDHITVFLRADEVCTSMPCLIFNLYNFTSI